MTQFMALYDLISFNQSRLRKARLFLLELVRKNNIVIAQSATEEERGGSGVAFAVRKL